ALEELRDAKCRVVVTSRPYGYQRGCLPFGVLTEYALAPLTPRQRRRFVRGWYPNDDEHGARVLELVQGNPSLAAAGSNGLLLTLVCFSGERHALGSGTRRVDVYRRVMRDLVRAAWREDALPETDAHVRTLLRLMRRVAWELFSANPSRTVFGDEEVRD